ncbi:hypothetical protein JCM10908_004284 [Rhodotorula pacifica]|uniref:uncharacterized protein n=1 Tax=Rhodotorula pacifica TaxID=1495444 RepID=UPI003173F859
MSGQGNKRVSFASMSGRAFSSSPQGDPAAEFYHFSQHKNWHSDSSAFSSSPPDDDSSSDDDVDDGNADQTAGLPTLDQYDDSGIGFGNLKNRERSLVHRYAFPHADHPALGPVELSTDAQRSFFEFKTKLENANERGRQVLQMTGEGVAHEVMEHINRLYDRLDNAVSFFKQQQDILVGDEAEVKLTELDNYIDEIVALKETGQAGRDQLKKDLDANHEETLQKVEALRTTYEKQCRALQNKLQRLCS